MKELIRFRQFLAEGLVNENQMKNLAKLLRDEADQPDNEVGKDIFLKYAAQAEKTDVKDIRSLLQKLEDELIGKHPDTFSGEDDIVGSFLSVSKNYLNEQAYIKPFEDIVELDLEAVKNFFKSKGYDDRLINDMLSDTSVQTDLEGITNAFIEGGNLSDSEIENLLTQAANFYLGEY